ncbi:MAG: flagellar biosynthetic protein FliQ [Rickettsiales bacterium]|nr:flagellar biosynthetic protein FliQ [Rickettsiales bacterium]|tara:strand:- start:162 stop:434 length:273 start_codon:yes stop_codon:yes gene_type:complete
MTPEFIISITQEAIQAILWISAPVVIVATVVGLAISIIQAATQIQEMTLVFVPKMFAVFVGLALFASFMLDTLARFTMTIFDLVAQATML